MRDAETFYIRTTFYTSLILVALYGILLVKIYRSNQYDFLIILTVMFVVSNIAAVLCNTFALQFSITDAISWLILQVIATIVRDSTFNLAHWIFCWKYWLIAVDMEALLF